MIERVAMPIGEADRQTLLLTPHPRRFPPCIFAWRWIIFFLERVEGAADRPALGHSRRLSSLGRR